jgi:hypothetical protein
MDDSIIETSTIIVGEDTGFPSELRINPETGEVLEDLGAPSPDTASALALADYIGPRKTAAEARLAAKVAERDAWIAKIDDIYGPQIKREQGYIAWLKTSSLETFRQYAAANLSGKTRSMTVGLLKLAFRSSARKIKVNDPAAALQWAIVNCPDAVKTTETVLISKIPAELLESGLVCSEAFYEEPASETFEVK